jgi:ABC-2 type transport system ATP-binding protein
LTAAGAAVLAPGAGDDAAVRTLELTKHYGAAVALSGLTMVVPRGEVFGFLGPNGSGKTTAVKLLLGLSRPTGGEAWVLGRRAGDRGARARIGYLPELFRYQGWLRSSEVLALHCRLAGLDRAEWPAQIARALATVGLTGHAEARVETFSKGMQQRLGLGVALLGDPELVILDEPTSALDPVGRADTRAIIRQLRERGCAVFLNSHLLGEVELICDRAAVVSDGRVLAIGRLDELLGTGGVRIRLTGLTDAGRASLARRGTVTDNDGWFVVQGVAAEAVPELVAEVVSSGARVYAVEPVRQTLEERFLALLGAEEAKWPR